MPQVDVFQQVRTQYERHPPAPPVGRSTKVLARSSTEFISDLPDKWRVDYERRNRHQHTGFFAYNHVPYRSFGNLKYTDAYDLVGDSLGVSVSKYPGKVYHLTHLIPEPVEHSDSHDQHQTIRVARDVSQRKPLPHSRSVGLLAIRQSLGAQERSLREVEGGSSYRESLDREEKRMDFLREIRFQKAAKTKLRANSGSEGAVPGLAPATRVSVHRSPMVHSASSKACLTLTDIFHHKPPPRRGSSKETQKDKEKTETETVKLPQVSTNQSSGPGRVGPNLYVALAAAHFKMQGRGEGEGECARNSIQQQRRYCVAKLKMIYALLCCLHNMRIRDLRSREPLSVASIKASSKRPLHSHHHDPHHHSHHHHHHGHHLRFGAHTPNLGHSLHLRHSAMHTGLSHEHSGHMTAPHHHHGKHLHVQHVHGHHHVLPKLGISQPKHVKFQPETWEDLLSLGQHDEDGGGGGGGGRGGGGGGAIAGHDQPVLGVSPLTLALHGSDPIHQQPQYGVHRTQRFLPPWQRQVVFVDEDDSAKKDPAKQLHDCIGAFQYSKNELAQSLRDALRERKQNLQKHLTTKLQELVLSPITEESLELMRERAYQLRREERAEEENKPPWFSQLEKEANAQSKNTEARALLEKLKFFLVVDMDTIPHVIEKLCLIVMSLPASHLCLHPVISAVKFVLEYILMTPPKLCDQWLELRRLPLVTTELPVNSPVYVLSLPL